MDTPVWLLQLIGSKLRPLFAGGKQNPSRRRGLSQLGNSHLVLCARRVLYDVSTIAGVGFKRSGGTTRTSNKAAHPQWGHTGSERGWDRGAVGTATPNRTRAWHSREGFHFLGFRVRWQRSRQSGRWYTHVEPSAKSRQRLRDKVLEQLNHWTRRRRIPAPMGLNIVGP